MVQKKQKQKPQRPKQTRKNKPTIYTYDLRGPLRPRISFRALLCYICAQ